MGFTLRIENAPEGTVLWNANFAEQAFDYDPIADSDWLGIDEAWVYPNSYDKEGNLLYCTTLRIWMLDADNNILLDVYNLGPIEDGRGYIYDCLTGELYEAELALPLLWPLFLIGGVGILGIGGALAYTMAKE